MCCNSNKQNQPKWIIVCYGVDDIAMTFKRVKLLLGCSIPDLTGPVVTACYKTVQQKQTI